MGQRTVILPDVHGCVDALNQSLEHAGFNPESDALVMLGDLCDRGRSYQEVLKKLHELSAQMRDRFVLLFGNHDLLAEQAITLQDIETILLWLENGGICLLTELQPTNPTSEVTYPYALERGHTIHQITYRNRYHRSAQKYSVDVRNGYAAFSACQELLQNAQYRHLHNKARIIHRIENGICLVHAAVDALCMQHGIEAINAKFERAKHNSNYNDFLPKDGKYGCIVNGRLNDHGFFDRETCNTLRDNNISLVIRGHENISKSNSHRQNILCTSHPHSQDGFITVLHLDRHISSGMRRGKAGWAYASVETNGDILTCNDAMPQRLCIGSMTKDGFEPTEG